MRSVRKAVDAARIVYGVERPLVLLRFMHDGREIFLKEIEADGAARFVNLSRFGQVAWEHVQDVLRDLDYESGVAVGWWPEGRDTPIVINPSVSFGRPYIAHKGASTDAVRSRFLAGESLELVAEDLDLTQAEAEAALRFELPNAA